MSGYTFQAAWPLPGDPLRLEIVTLRMVEMRCARCRRSWHVREDIHPRQQVCTCGAGPSSAVPA